MALLLNDLNKLNTRQTKLSLHSHIQGLGLEYNLQDVSANPVLFESDGFVGQIEARKAAYIALSLIKEKSLSGRIMILAGKSGTGKTAIAYAMSQALGNDIPFTHLIGSEVYSMNLSKCEVLTQALRQSVAVYIKDQVEVVVGEVVEIIIETTKNGTRKASLTLKTTDMEGLYKIGPKLILAFEKKNITSGDIISLDKKIGRVTKLGRAYNRSIKYDAVLNDDVLMETPSGELQQSKEVNYHASLHDIDVINSRTEGFTALFAGDTGEIPYEIRQKVDEKISEWILEEKAKLVPGVLFIDESYLLDIECFSFLNKALEVQGLPLVILSTNKGLANVRGTNQISPHGISTDLLDRAWIINTKQYTIDECRKILQLRISHEQVSIDTDAAELLVQIATKSSLRYTINLIALCKIYAYRKNHEAITVSDVEATYKLFFDVGRSIEYIKRMDKLFC